MICRPDALACRLIRLWTRTYTAGLPPEARERRIAEIDSDIWEFVDDAQRRGEAAAVTASHLLWRWIAGMADDLLWRMETPMNVKTVAWVTGVAVLAGAVWVAYLEAPITLPPPAPLRQLNVTLATPPPPPPPPPNMR